MKVLFDSQVFESQNFGGISRYFSELLSILPSLSVEVDCNIKYSNNKHLLEKRLAEEYPKQLVKFPGKARLKKVLGLDSKVPLKSLIKKNGYDVFHPTYYNPAFLNDIGAKPFVLTVHDMIHELYYNEYYQNISIETFAKEKLISKAAAIVAVSNATKNDILKLYPETDPGKIKVIYHGNPFNSVVQATKHEFAFEKRNSFILYVGHRKFYKNLYWSLEVLAPYLLEKNLTLMCAGGGKFDEYEKRLFMKLGLTNHVVHVEIESDRHLYELYSSAKLFFYPSRYEGFGIPVLEAFAASCPALLSKNGCFEEVAQNAASFFILDNPDSLIQAVDECLNNESYRQQLVENGLLRVNYFTWEKCAKEHLELYESII